MKIVMYGNPLGVGGYLTELPFLLNGRIERIYKDAVDLQDLECDIAIANFTRDPLNSGNETGWNYLKLPKAKVQLAIQAEHFSEYHSDWIDGITHNFDGSICYNFNRPFFEFDDTIHPCFARSYWEENNIPIKPCFFFDPLVKWNNFYKGPLTNFDDYGFMVGSSTVHRDRISKSNTYKYRYMNGDMRKESIQTELKKAGIAWNIHKFDISGKNPETDGKEVKNVEKTEAIKIAFFYNLGMAVISEKLDHTFPDRLKDSMIEVDDIDKHEINKNKLIDQALNTQKVFNAYHDLDTEVDNLLNNIIKEYNL